jgi:hypothetical protein
MNFSKIGMTAEHAGVKASAKIDKSPVVLGKVSFAGGGVHVSLSRLKKLKKRLESFLIHSHVTFIPAPSESIKDWKIGFIQIVRENTSRAVYGGRIQDEGSVVCDPNLSPTRPRVVLDAMTTATIPFDDVPDDVTNLTMSPDTGDSPEHTVPLIVGNDAVRGVDNFLASYENNAEFWTVLTVMEPSKSLHFLAHIHWQVIFRCGVLWRGGEPIASDQSSIKFDSMADGAPTDAAVSAILSTPTGPIANDVLVITYNNSFICGAQADPVTHRASPGRDFFIPQFFWE